MVLSDGLKHPNARQVIADIVDEVLTAKVKQNPPGLGEGALVAAAAALASSGRPLSRRRLLGFGWLRREP